MRTKRLVIFKSEIDERCAERGIRHATKRRRRKLTNKLRNATEETYRTHYAPIIEAGLAGELDEDTAAV